jgi:hypothetical protein
MSIEESVAKAAFNQENCLFALACDDLVIRVIDMSSRSIVRFFHGNEYSFSEIVSQNCFCNPYFF